MSLFFFFKQKTAYEMRISDWSSDVCSSDLRLHAGLGDLVAEAALIVLGHDRPLDLVALVEEGQAEGELQVAAEDVSVLRPGDHGAGRHHGRDVAGHEAGPRQIGAGDYLRHLIALLGAPVARALEIGR